MSPIQFSYKHIFAQLKEIDELAVRNEFALAKSLLEKNIDAKKKVELISRYKKARTKLQAVEQFLK